MWVTIFMQGEPLGRIGSGPDGHFVFEPARPDDLPVLKRMAARYLDNYADEFPAAHEAGDASHVLRYMCDRMPAGTTMACIPDPVGPQPAGVGP